MKVQAFVVTLLSFVTRSSRSWTLKLNDRFVVQKKSELYEIIVLQISQSFLDVIFLVLVRIILLRHQFQALKKVNKFRIFVSNNLHNQSMLNLTFKSTTKEHNNEKKSCDDRKSTEISARLIFRIFEVRKKKFVF